MAAFVVLGVSNSVIDAPFFAILTVQTPATLRPKVFTALLTLSTISAPIGALAAGPLLYYYGAPPPLCSARSPSSWPWQRRFSSG